jgi:hypothetical protein
MGRDPRICFRISTAQRNYGEGPASLVAKSCVFEFTFCVLLTPPLEDNQDGDVLNLPGAVNLDASIRFNPRQATIEAHGLEVGLSVDTIVLDFDILLKLSREVTFAGLRGSSPVVPSTPPGSPFMQVLSVRGDLSSVPKY